MDEPRVLAWDVGGVLLSNGWDRAERRAVCEEFGIDATEFERRHVGVVDAFERGRVTLDGYLDQTLPAGVPGTERSRFRARMFDQTSADEPMLEFVRGLAGRPEYRLVTLNDESRELNLDRIRRFRLTEVFESFFSSCFTGLRKPAPEAFRLVADVTQRPPGEIVFIDDRAENVAAGVRAGLASIQFHGLDQLRADLGRSGIRVS